MYQVTLMVGHLVAIFDPAIGGQGHGCHEMPLMHEPGSLGYPLPTIEPKLRYFRFFGTLYWNPR